VRLKSTPIFLFIKQNKILPISCLYTKDGTELTDIQLVELLVATINQTDTDRIEMINTIQKMEQHILKKYGEIYDSVDDK